MPQWRKLHTKTTDSLDVNDMPDDFTRLTWVLLPLKLCREGRGYDIPSWIKSQLYPLRADVTADMVQGAMDWFEARGMIRRYTVDGRPYFQVESWEKYQGNTSREAESSYPEPPELGDESKSRATHEPVESDSSLDVDVDAEEMQTHNGARAGSEHSIATEETQHVHKHFCRLTGVDPPPERNNQAWKEWIADLNTILGLCDDDIGRAAELVEIVVDYMDQNGLTYTRPGSLVNIARRFTANPPKGNAQSGTQAARQKAELTFDWLVKQGQEYGRMRFKEWGVPEDVRSAANNAIGHDFPEKVTGPNPYQYQKDFVNEYAKQQSSATA